MAEEKKISIPSKNTTVKNLSERLKRIFESKNPKTKLVAYFVGCHPNYKTSLKIIKQAIDNGISVVELGFCTSEASAEGPIIKAAHDRCLKNKVSLKDNVKLAKEIRKYNDKVGIIHMGYIANLYMYPITKFVEDIAKAESDGVLVVDAPHELKEENILREKLNSYNLSLIKLVAPTTPDARLKLIANLASGFIYCVNVKGITGVKSALQSDVSKMIKKIKSVTSIPVCSGFGIKTPKDAKMISKTGCNGIVVGTTIVSYIEKNLKNKNLPQKIGKLVKSFSKELN